MTPYYEHDGITIFHADCREVPEWREADVLVTDPPYGRAWRQGFIRERGQIRGDNSHDGIANDNDTTVRDEALEQWGDTRLAIVFGTPMLGPPAGTRQALGYLKAPNAGQRGATAGFRRDLELIYLVGPWPIGIGGRSSVLTSATRSAGNPSSPQGKNGHPHAKPTDLMTELVELAPGAIADPFMGSGTTLVAAKQLGRQAIGVELDEAHCERAAARLEHGVLALW